MAPATALKARGMLKERCPDLALGQYKTFSSALHKITFVGTLKYWNGFETAVKNACKAIDWRNYGANLSHRPKGNPGDAHLSHEHVVCGDETGVQGRFESNVGQIVSAVFKAMNQPITFGDYKPSQRARALGDKVPDVVCFSTIDSDLRVVGEVKVPWVKDHDLSLAYEDRERKMRHVLGKQDIHAYSTYRYQG